MLTRLISKFRENPVLLATAAIIALQAYEAAATKGLGLEDMIIAVITALVGWLTRELVYPAVHVEAAEVALLDAEIDNEPLGDPYLGDNA